MKKPLIIPACFVACAFLLACPFFLSTYWVRIITNIFMFAVLAQGINVITGFTGYPALGNVVFFGLGAYGTGVLMIKFQQPFFVGLAAGAAICVLFTLLFGIPVLRLKGHYFAIATLGLNEATRAVVDNLTGLTGGGMGLSLPLPPGNVSGNTLFFYYVMFGVLASMVTATFFLSISRFGYACRSIRADEDAARSMGVNATWYKTTAWMISAVFTSMAGSIYAYWMTYIEPSAVFDMTISIKAFVMFLIGGAGTVVGPVLGAFFIEIVSTLAWSRILSFHTGLLGLIIILAVIFMPRGFVSFLKERFSF